MSVDALLFRDRTHRTSCFAIRSTCPSLMRVPSRCTPMRLHAVTPTDRSQFRGHGRMQGTLAARCTSPARCFPARVGSCAYTCSLATACSCHYLLWLTSTHVSATDRSRAHACTPALQPRPEIVTCTQAQPTRARCQCSAPVSFHPPRIPVADSPTQRARVMATWNRADRCNLISFGGRCARRRLLCASSAAPTAKPTALMRRRRTAQSAT